MVALWSCGHGFGDEDPLGELAPPRRELLRRAPQGLAATPHLIVF
jgi:hypothetical protein